MWERFVHKWLKVPYTLHVHRKRTKTKPRATILFIHGIGNSSKSWRKIIDKMPNDVEVIAVDLLGFGNSSKPDWVKYDARLQARSVVATLARMIVTKRLIIVGHSLGSLVAIEIAKKYPIIIQRLILCSPPIYRPESVQRGVQAINSDRVLRRLFHTATKHPQQFMTLTTLAVKYNLLNPHISLNHANIDAYMATLDAAIINQTAYDDLMRIKTSTKIIYGVLDPFIIAKNLKKIAKTNQNITLEKSVHGHEIRGIYVATLVRQLQNELKQI